MFSAAIYTTGRTGSHIIVKNLASHFQVPYCEDRSTNIDNNSLVHAHNPLWTPPNNNFICILSKRRNLFDTIMSTLIGKVSDEFTSYTNKLISPMVVTELEFTRHYWFMKTYYKVIDTSQFSQVIEIYYEELINDPKYLFSLFNIDQDTMYSQSTKSPYHYNDLILNVTELKTLFNDLEKLPVTSDMVESLRNTIAIDLDSIYAE